MSNPGAIYDLGAGNNNGQTGGTIISSSAILSGLRASVVRSFTTPNQAPTVTLSARETTINEDGSTTLTATASDTDGAIVTYAFNRGSTLLQSGPLNTYKFGSPTAGSHSFTVTVTDDDGATSISSSVTVRVNPTSVPWANVNGDGLYDEVLATLARPVQSVGGTSSTTVNGVTLEIEEIIDVYLDPSGSLDIFLVSIRVPSSLIPVGFNYQFQHATTADSRVNAGSVRPGSTNGLYECPITGTISQTEYFA